MHRFCFCSKRPAGAFAWSDAGFTLSTGAEPPSPLEGEGSRRRRVGEGAFRKISKEASVSFDEVDRTAGASSQIKKSA